jgi:hypothetical protein
MEGHNLKEQLRRCEIFRRSVTPLGATGVRILEELIIFLHHRSLTCFENADNKMALHCLAEAE